MTALDRTRRRPRLTFVCGREPSYVRNRLLLRGLTARFDVDVITSAARSYPARFASIVPRMLKSARASDLVVAGFLGQPLALFTARVLRKPVLLDAMISVYDTLCLDRQVTRPESIVGQVAFALDRQSMSAAQLVLVDTAAHGDFFARTFGIPRQNLFVHYVGPDFDIDSAEMRRERSSAIDVVHYSSYLPLHGIDTIVRAAKLLGADRHVRFRLIGSGPEYGRVRLLAEQAHLKNIDFFDWQPAKELRRSILAADIGLGGHFANNAKARRVIAGKTFQFLAAGRPTIVGDSAGNRELLEPGIHAAYVPHDDPEALAEAVALLASDPAHRERLGRTGKELMQWRFAPARVADDLERAVDFALA